MTKTRPIKILCDEHDWELHLDPRVPEPAKSKLFLDPERPEGEKKKLGPGAAGLHLDPETPEPVKSKKVFLDKHWPSPRPKGLSLKEGTWLFDDTIELPIYNGGGESLYPELVNLLIPDRSDDLVPGPTPAFSCRPIGPGV